jgi:hypothetical protein
MFARAGLLLLLAITARAQTIPGAVLAKREPHHHLAYEDSSIRVLRVRVPAHDTTLLHEHDRDYVWVGLGSSTLINAKPGVADATIVSADLSFHYSFGNFAHVARNPGAEPFDNITIELLEPQTDVRNLCEPVIADKPLDCDPPSARAKAFFSGATEHPALTTAQMRVSLVTIAAGGILRATAPARTVWVIALDSADAGRGLVLEGAAKWVGGSFRAGRESRWGIKNRGGSPIRVVTLVRVAPDA